MFTNFKELEAYVLSHKNKKRIVLANAHDEPALSAVVNAHRRGVEHGVIWQSGAGFGDGDCIRINAALPHALVREAMDRLEKYVFVG